jgi:hypothetical protein
MTRIAQLVVLAVLVAPSLFADCPTAAGAPALSAPADGTVVTAYNPTRFEWTAAGNANTLPNSYDVLFSSDGVQFLARATTQGTETGTSVAIPPGTYLWKVRAVFAACSIESTSQRRITANCPSISITPNSLPTATKDTAYSSTLTASGGATPYTFSIASGSLPNGMSLSATGTLAGTPSQAGNFTFLVKVVDANGCSGGQGYSLTVLSSACATPLAFDLASPANGSALTNTPTLSWKASTNADFYRVHIATTDPPSELATDPAVPATTTSYTPNTLQMGKYFWSVTAVANCTSTTQRSGSSFSFTITPTTNLCPTVASSPVSPADGATVSSGSVTLRWTAVSNAASYVVFAGLNGATPTNIGSTNSASSTSITIPVPDGAAVEWFVRASRNGCPDLDSAHSHFSTPKVCSGRAPTLISPANGATGVTSPVTFTWSEVDGATKYQLSVSVNGGAPAIIGTTADTTFTADLPGGSIQWVVEAIFPSCPATTSSPSQFTAITPSTCPASPQSPTTISPADGATNVSSPVLLQWSSVASATGYRIFAFVGTSNSSNNAEPVLLGSTQATQLSVSLPSGSVVWYVEALFGDKCPTTVSPRARFTVVSTTTCPTAAAMLTQPANGATGIHSPVTFQWGAVTAAVGYRLFGSLNGSSFTLLGETSDTSLEEIVPPGAVAWYVETEYAGCPSQKSAIFSFTATDERNCGGGTIALTAPANGTSVGSPVTFSWTAASGASDYRVWVSVNGGSPSIVAHATGTTVTTSLPSGNIEWLVEATFSNCPSILSPLGHFSVAQANGCDSHLAPALVSPTSGMVTNPVDFVWNASAGAIAYHVWTSSDGKPLVDLGLTRDTHLQHTVEEGRVVWFVEAVFEGCPSLPSQKATFQIAITARCGNAAPSIVSPADHATNVTSPVTFLWSAVANVEEYRVFAKLGTADFSLVGHTHDTSITLPAPPGLITWFVEAAFEACSSTRSATATFTVPAAPMCGTAVPTLVAPADGATNITSPVDFVWNPVSGAARYRLFVKIGNDTPTPIAETDETHFVKAMKEGTIEWWVVAFFPGCPPAESAHSTFTIPSDPTCNNPAPTLLTPPDDAQDLASPVHFSWTPLAKAKGYRVWAAVGLDRPSLIGVTSVPVLDTPAPSGDIHWFVEAFFDTCPTVTSATSSFTVAKTPPPCATPARPQATVVGQTLSGTPYAVRWTPVPNANVYEIQESTSLDFSGATTTTVNGVSATFSHLAPTVPIQYLYRVHGVSACSDERGPFSNIIGVFVVPPPSTGNRNSSAEIGTQTNVVQTLFLPGSQVPISFVAKPDKPWLTVTPSMGTIPPAGITLIVTSDPSVLGLGTNTGTVSITYSSSGKTGSNAASQPTTIPVSITLATPVGSGGKSAPLPNSLIIPAVGHAPGANNSQFQSDVRLTNTSAQTMKYLLNFTPSGTDGTISASSTTIQVDPGVTTALDDILTTFFGSGATASATGTLEIRPLTTTSAPTFGPPPPGGDKATVASSRTFNFTDGGTFGQYVPAIPFSQFIGQYVSGTIPAILSLQQIAQSAAYRTNLGLVEAAGEPASVMISVYDNANHLLGQIPQTLLPGEHRQLNSFLATNNISLTDGRIEIAVTSATGKVSAYASVLDNLTNDPLLVSPVLKFGIASSRYVLPGVADLNNGVASWRTDMRIYNAGSQPATATLTYFAQPGNPGAAAPVQITLAPGEVKAIDNTLQSLFNLTNSGGSMLVTTPTSSSLITTARTYNQTGNGTYGQFIPGVTPADSVGLGGRALQILQLEQSSRLRSNIGIAETTGNDATVEVAVILSDSKVSPIAQIPLAANGFRQISLGDFNLGTVYNARMTVRVISGSGKVTAYGSVIDQLTQDPTYVPAQ